MKKATRILALVLCAVMCLGLFVGCGNKGKQNNDTPLVVGYSPFNSKFSPFFSETAYDQDVWVMTAISLLNGDRQGAIIMKGIEGETKAYNGTDYTYYGPADCEIVQTVQLSIEEYLKECWKNKQEVIDVSAYKLNEEELNKVIFGIHYENPEYYWVLRNTAINKDEETGFVKTYYQYYEWKGTALARGSGSVS